MPDDELLSLGARGEILKPDVLRRADRATCSKTPKSSRFVHDFTDQWLETHEISATQPDPFLYPEHDNLLQASLNGEVHGFVKELLEENLPVDNFLDSDFSILNERLAKHYGIQGVTGNEFRKVSLPADSPRGGLVTMASVLKITANGSNTSPVLRGVWVLDRLMGRPPNPPPPMTPAIEPDTRGATTIRDLLEKHRADTACASCHDRIDPPGFALESFDVIGTFRENYRIHPKEALGKTNREIRKMKHVPGKKVDPSGTLPDGNEFADIHEYKKFLMGDRDQFLRSLATRLLVYGTGHRLEFSDREPLRELLSHTAKDGRGLRTLVHNVVQSPTFRKK